MSALWKKWALGDGTRVPRCAQETGRCSGPCSWAVASHRAEFFLFCQYLKFCRSRDSCCQSGSTRSATTAKNGKQINEKKPTWLLATSTSFSRSHRGETATPRRRSRSPSVHTRS